MASLDSGGLDCDDSRDDVYPRADELCDGRDNDCEGTVDLGADGLGVCRVEHLAVPPVDVLFVVDNSGGFNPTLQELLADAAVALRGALAARGSDFHLGAISTDFAIGGGRLMEAEGVRWVGPDTAGDPDAILRTMVELGIDGSDERARDSAWRGLVDLTGPGGYNHGFLRDQAALELVFLSDEDDHSDLFLADFQAFLLGADPVPGRSHAVVVTTPGSCPEAVQEGVDYLALAQATGGLALDLCAPDYLPVTDTVLETLSTTPVRRFPLPPGADPDTVSATVFAPEGAVLATWPADTLTWVDDQVALPEPVPLDHRVELAYALLPPVD